MMEEELIKIWQSSPNQERVKFEKSKLMIDVQSSLDHFHKRIKYRDLTEQLGAMTVIPVFAYYAYRIPFMLTKVASVLVIAWVIYVLIRLKNAKKFKPGKFTESYLEYLHKSRVYLNIQKDMIDNVLYWYILPPMAIIFLFLAGLPSKAKHLFLAGTLNVTVGVGIYFLNKWTVRKQYIPRLAKIDELIAVMEKNGV